MGDHYINYIGVKSFGVINYKNYKIDLFVIRNYNKFSKNALGDGWVGYRGYACYVACIPYKVCVEAIYKMVVKSGLY